MLLSRAWFVEVIEITERFRKVYLLLKSFFRDIGTMEFNRAYDWYICRTDYGIQLFQNFFKYFVLSFD